MTNCDLLAAVSFLSGASNVILTTWQISFDYIGSKRQSATDLLSLMSFFDR